MAPAKLLAIVPARGGSKGVARKNMRLIRGRPLLDYTLTALRHANVADRILVSSDDDSILAWAELHGYETHLRQPMLADDATTISEVAASIVEQLDWAGDVGIFQPTSPLRTSSSIIEAVSAFRRGRCDSLASCVRESHLYWYDQSGTNPKPLFDERVNRQYAVSRVMRETGAIQLIKAEALRHTPEMVTDKHELFEVPESDALDIDTPEDLALARRRLEGVRIVFRLTANSHIGSGHLFHCLQLADELDEHTPVFLLRDCDPFAAELLDGRGYEWRHEGDLTIDLTALREDGFSVVVNDVLDTTDEDVLRQRAMGFLVVNIEDLGSGAPFAHWVVNALYKSNRQLQNAAWGPRWATLREEFHFPPQKPLREKANRVLITFGGTDPNKLGERCASLLASNDPELDIRVILGPGAEHYEGPDSVSVLEQVQSMAMEMHEADIVLTSAGRTIYEASAMGVPMIVLAQNAREATHAHLSYETGVIFLGIGPLVEDEHIVGTAQRLLADHKLRGELSTRLARSIDPYGTSRIADQLRALIREHK
jgi:CMP-N-acetylneuraminic acid synthetase/spore coat polysaccharide biosynthesis predicted glycosyltransferase SpsG